MTDTNEQPRILLNKRGQPTRRLVNGPDVLNSRMRRMIELMVWGHPDDPSGTPYTVFDAARAVGYRMKAARHLSRSPVFCDALNIASARFEETGVRSAIPTLDDLDPDPDLGARRLPFVAPRRPDPPAPGYVIKAPAPRFAPAPAVAEQGN
jgi:hypothetical protein